MATKRTIKSRYTEVDVIDKGNVTYLDLPPVSQDVDERYMKAWRAIEFLDGEYGKPLCQLTIETFVENDTRKCQHDEARQYIENAVNEHRETIISTALEHIAADLDGDA